jgi:HEAT repeat protein
VRQHAASSSSAQQPEVEATLRAASREDNAQLREGAAYALGVLGTDAANERLVSLLGDGQANVRFNAATGLARQGRPEALEVLIEMLDIDHLEGVAEEEGPQAQDFKRALIVINGLRAARQLLVAKPELETAPLKHAVDRLLEVDLAKSFQQADYAAEVRAQARELREAIR